MTSKRSKFRNTGLYDHGDHFHGSQLAKDLCASSGPRKFSPAEIVRITKAAPVLEAAQ